MLETSLKAKICLILSCYRYQFENGGLNGDETEKVNKKYEIQMMYKKIEKLYFKLNLKYPYIYKKKIEQNISGIINLN